jgi:hypothetical protein
MHIRTPKVPKVEYFIQETVEKQNLIFLGKLLKKLRLEFCANILL